MTRQVIRYFLW